MNEALRNKLFALLDKHILPDRRRDTGRPGMDLWAVLVMGVLKQGLRCDYDRLQDLVNAHAKIRQMLGHGPLDESEYEIQNIRDNVELMTPELLREVSQLIARTDARLSRKKPGAALIGRCDSFVAETDVHHPTDFNLLRDSLRCLLRETARACGESGVSGWRQWKHLRGNVEALYRRADKSLKWRDRPDDVRAYLDAALKIADRAQASLATLRAGGTCPEAALGEIDRLLRHARRFAGQIEHRVLRGDKIPHGEKVFSIFEEHTRWISKGKAGRKAELGVPVCVVEDGNGFVLDHEIMWSGGDTDVAAPLIRRCLKAFPNLRGCSFDRGFHSPSNRKALDDLLELNALPKKGGKSAAEREREAEPAFAAARRKHSGVESTINNLEHRGQDKVRLRGADGFELAVGLSVAAPDIHRLGLNLREAERKRMRRRRRKCAA